MIFGNIALTVESDVITFRNVRSISGQYTSDIRLVILTDLFMDENRIEVQIESFAYRHSRKVNLQNIRFQLSGGQPHTLFGPSGCGKSTLLGALLPDPEGVFRGRVSYLVDGVDMTPDEVCRKGLLGFMAQSPALLPWRTIRENLEVPSLLNREHLLAPDESALVTILDEVSLPETVLDQLPHQLSFGMKQRIAFARALLYRPRFLLLDEVYTGLDVATVSVIEKFLVRYTSETNAVALIVTHNLETTLRNSLISLFLSHTGTLQKLSSSTTTEDLTALFVSELKYN
jgi:NitT/TauT family transport system ATP-binding protein